MRKSTTRIRRRLPTKKEAGRELGWQKIVAGIFSRPELPGFQNLSASTMLDTARDELLNQRTSENPGNKGVHIRNLAHALRQQATLSEYRQPIKDILAAAAANSPFPEIKSLAASKIEELKRDMWWQVKR